MTFFHRLARNNMFSMLDMAGEFWQISFYVHYAIREFFKRIPFGIMSEERERERYISEDKESVVKAFLYTQTDLQQLLL